MNCQHPDVTVVEEMVGYCEAYKTPIMGVTTKHCDSCGARADVVDGEWVWTEAHADSAK